MPDREVKASVTTSEPMLVRYREHDKVGYIDQIEGVQGKATKQEYEL